MQIGSNLKTYALIGLGGAIGAITRHGVSIIITAKGFPFATLCANLIGCFLLSFFLSQDAIRKKLSPDLFAAMNIGIIGSFTTFSTFAIETIELWRTSELAAMTYCLMSIIGGLISCFLGYTASLRKVREQG
ncbi:MULTISPECIES: fluoride efflux transporter CrcB [Virgibacillus]|uniref:Fluoride-specific ion channel FluC n=2 Tax=Virgibacillus TaxID=84406 RepID=A0A024QAA1_9BACI|nr:MULTISPECIES: fluoride efflux transporter CrcB [Virgibacillus]MYL40115.1 fluoride efflux transporter CrcB [Virgibacillus massiliensis]GGJ61471.1 putative fluoride ion transporter CrcB 1 [Virgibacillus kapii]CDQ39140.1 camphor resistance protein CrcB [Virgibacillus massiliensis]